MTAARVNRVVRTWQKRLALDHWNLRIDLDNPAPPGSDANVKKSDHYQDAVMRLAAPWREWGSWLINYIAVHELLHVAMRDTDFANEQCIERVPGEEVQALLEQTYVHAVEGFIDRLAAALVDEQGEVT